MRCPGQDTRFWKPGDIFDLQCPKCGTRVEFFRDEVRRKCKCGHEIINPKMNLACAAWCQYAEQCLGAAPDEVKAKQKAEQKELLKERIALEVKKYLGTDFKRLKHALKVVQYAERILKIEGGNPLVVLGAAYLHDLGIHEAEKKYGVPATEHPRREGVPLAREILERLGVESQWVDEICRLVEHHHPETLNEQILYEADCLAHVVEGAVEDRKRLGECTAGTFKTATGRQLADKLGSLD